ncbi:unnamed protein product [Prorocentrum cordatum]|uniref:ERCC4 domain-containing protein n=1 Tax=Prorocentrum cordatum TaxID=2364126 RepID=A0ABN9RRP6_9DINO|nr:unnamed protein product [Polarella glacialis]
MSLSLPRTPQGREKGCACSDSARHCSASPRWAYVECDFPYAAHRAAVAQGNCLEVTGTTLPLLLVFLEAPSAELLTSAAVGALSDWLAAHGPLQAARLLLLLYGTRPASLRPAVAAPLAASLVRRGAGAVELEGPGHAAEYAAQCAAAVSESRRRRVPSRFKVAGARCQTLPRDASARLRVTWVSQLMQIPGVSEEIAKVIAEHHPSPAAILGAVASAGASSGSAFLADLEYPIKGRSGTRKVGPVVSRRVFTMFSPEAEPEHLLL